MYCSKCGTQNPESAKFCSKCGLPMNQTIPVSTPSPIDVPVSTPVQSASFQQTEVTRRTSGLAIASLVLGILGVSLLAIIFGAVALNATAKDPNLSGKGIAIAGLILGILGFLIGIIIAIVAILAASQVT